MFNTILTIVVSTIGLMSGNVNVSDETPDALPATCNPCIITPATAVDVTPAVTPTANTDVLNVALIDSLIEQQNKFNNIAEDIVATAKKYIGARYRMGSVGPYQFDCSGFTSYIYKKAGISITRTSRSQFTEGIKIHRTQDLEIGDLVFFGGRKSPRSVGHVGIVTEVDEKTGVFKFIHASSRGVGIDKSTASYYSPRYLGARRILTEKKG